MQSIVSQINNQILWSKLSEFQIKTFVGSNWLPRSLIKTIYFLYMLCIVQTVHYIWYDDLVFWWNFNECNIKHSTLLFNWLQRKFQQFVCLILADLLFICMSWINFKKLLGFGEKTPTQVNKLLIFLCNFR